MSERWEVVLGDETAIDCVGPLFRSMVEHHRLLAGEDWPVRDADEAWQRRRPQYEGWLAAAEGSLLLALPRGGSSSEPVGYAFVRVHEPGPTWDLGEQIAELESLAVADHLRGAGIGTELIKRSRELLRSKNVRYWSVAVVAANDGAARLYERAGFRPYYNDLLGEV